MNDTYSTRETVVTYNKRSFLTPVGAMIALIGFFLPWINYSPGRDVQTFSGSGIGGMAWVVFAAAIVILVAHFLIRSEDHSKNASLPIVVIAVLIGLGVILFRYLFFADAQAGPVGGIQSIQFGLILTVIGFVLSLIGALLSRNESYERVPTTNSAVRLNDQPSYSEEKKDL